MKPAPDIAVFDTPGLDGFKDTLEQALVVLGQHDIAMAFAAAVIEQDYVILALEDSAMHDGERASVDHDQKIVFLRRHDDALELALTLHHEFCHISQLHRGGLSMNLTQDHPHLSLKKLMVMEADARAHEARLALDLEPLFPGILKTMTDKSNNPAITELIARAGDRIDDKKDAVMAGVFKSIFLHAPLRCLYEGMVMEKLHRLADRQALAITPDAPQKNPMHHLAAHGSAYINIHSDYIGDNKPPLHAVMKTTMQQLATLAEKTGCADLTNITVLETVTAGKKHVKRPAF